MLATDAIASRRIRGPQLSPYAHLHRLADQARPSVRSIFERAVRYTKDQALEAKIEFGIRNRSVELALSAIPWDSIGSVVLKNRMRERLQRLVLESGIASQRSQPRGLDLRLGTRIDRLGEDLQPPPAPELQFDARNPYAVREAIEKAAALIAEVDEETRQAIRELIADAINRQESPAKIAKRVRQMIGLTTRQQAAILKLVDQGEPESVVWREIRKALRYRAELIAHTETMRAANQGQQALWESARSVNLLGSEVRREYVATSDSHVCPECEALDGRTYGLHEQIWSKFGLTDTPPIHPACRCVMVLRTRPIS